MKRLGILGTLVLDTIHDPGGGEPVRALGGLAYALSAFERVRPPGWTALPILKVGRDARQEAASLLDSLRSVGSREGVVEVPEPNNRVELVYREDGSRTERLEGGVPGWGREELEPLARSCDALYVNFIAGWEVELTAARRLRDVVAGPVYCDLHSLLLDHGPGGHRRPRAPEAWREWVACFDYLQLNEDELSILADEEGEEPWTLAESLIGEAPRAVFVTLGPGGAAWRAVAGAGGREGPSRDGRVDRGRLSAPPVEEAGGPTADGAVPDVTGCGDVWGITCFAALLEGGGPAEAVAAANRMGARNAGLRGGTALLGADAGEEPDAAGNAAGTRERGR